MTLQEKINKTDDKIIQLELEIEERKEKLKKLKAQKKALETKLDKEFADKLVKTILARGVSTEEERENILRQISSLSAQVPTTPPNTAKHESAKNPAPQSEMQISQNSENALPKTYP